MKTWRGFSLVELLVGMAILGVLLAIAMPAFSNWLRNARVRTAAESVQNGLQLARAEAVRRNTTIRFQLVDTTDDSCALSTAGPNWVVSFDPPVGACATPPSDTVAPRIIQSRSGAEGSSATTLTADQSTLVFNSLGRTTGNVVIDVASATGELCLVDGGPIRCLRIMVSLGGQIRMCDLALAVGDAQACT
ncbi:MAG: GspH/FimT family pseudopilin [Accumulibacter sp.]|uniref:GspH/FimT family pseudopilin n=1 Tax=Accumulibacter sp. TaxID=2053492 RepID=UPI003315C2AE